VNITLRIATASSAITVIDEAPIIQAETSDVFTTFNQKQISEVPNPGNDLTYIVQTTPGVVMNTDVPNAPGMNFSILGMPSTSCRSRSRSGRGPTESRWIRSAGRVDQWRFGARHLGVGRFPCAAGR
jgi:hypothetical protein